jgi:ADP-dependent phosphofructokinase/glucokinase
MLLVIIRLWLVRERQKNSPRPTSSMLDYLAKLFHTITQGHPEPQKLLQEVLDSAIEEFNRTVESDKQALDEFTVVGKL